MTGKLYFKRPKMSGCIGYMQEGTCQQCIERTPGRALGCNRLGDYLNKKDWNRIIGRGPLYQRDMKAREAAEVPDMKGRIYQADVRGRRVA